MTDASATTPPAAPAPLTAPLTAAIIPMSAGATTVPTDATTMPADTTIVPTGAITVPTGAIAAPTTTDARAATTMPGAKAASARAAKKVNEAKKTIFDVAKTTDAIKTIFKDYKDAKGKPARWVLFTHGTLVMLDDTLMKGATSIREAAIKFLAEVGEVVIGTEAGDFGVYEQTKYFPEGGVFVVVFHFPQLMGIGFSNTKANGSINMSIGLSARDARHEDWQDQIVATDSEA